MNEYTVVRGGPDWFSRLISLGSLAVAGAALFYVYKLQPVKHETMKPADNMQAAALGSDDSPTATDFTNRDAAEGQQTAARDRRPIDWDAPVRDPRDARFDTPVESAVDLRQPSHSESDAVAADDLGMTGDNDLDDDLNDDLNDDLDDGLGPIAQPSRSAPRLAEVRTAFRPSGQPDSITTVIRNAGDGDARVSEVVFRPNRIMELNLEASQPQWTQTDNQQLVIYFNQFENLTTTPGKHGDYVRELKEPFTVAAGKTAKFNLAIRNPEHQGWGLRGRLTLRLSNGDDFEVEDVTLAFVGS